MPTRHEVRRQALIDDAARVIEASGMTVATFDTDGLAVTWGAHLDPRNATGEVVLRQCFTPRDHLWARFDLEPVEEHQERADVIRAYADVFRASGWSVQEITAPGADDVQRPIGLVLKNPAA